MVATNDVRPPNPGVQPPVSGVTPLAQDASGPPPDPAPDAER